MSEVAVVISSYQAEQYIECAIRSVLAQDLTGFELLVQDDASTDRTVEIANSIQDPRLRVVVSGANQGAVANFNSGIDGTRAEFVVKLDADDFLLPGFLHACCEALGSDGSLAFVFTEAQRIAQGRPAGLMTGWPASVAMSGRDFILAALAGGDPCSASAVMFRRTAFRAAGGFRWPTSGAPFGEDYTLWLRMAATGSVRFLPEPLSAYRAHPAGLTGRLRNPALREPFRHMVDELERAIEFARARGVLAGSDLARANRLLARHCLRAADACAFLPEHRAYSIRQAWRLSAREVALSRHSWRLALKLAVGVDTVEQIRRSRRVHA
ncbi:MAG TPA: glycosyltransferase [Bryobacteraceae bacterium]|nr:glycosyltransferase [Bryobacteraceae bacterium]